MPIINYLSYRHLLHQNFLSITAHSLCKIPRMSRTCIGHHSCRSWPLFYDFSISLPFASSNVAVFKANFSPLLFALLLLRSLYKSLCKTNALTCQCRLLVVRNVQIKSINNIKSLIHYWSNHFSSIFNDWNAFHFKSYLLRAVQFDGGNNNNQKEYEQMCLSCDFI